MKIMLDNRGVSVVQSVKHLSLTALSSGLDLKDIGSKKAPCWPPPWAWSQLKKKKKKII